MGLIVRRPERQRGLRAVQRPPFPTDWAVPAPHMSLPPPSRRQPQSRGAGGWDQAPVASNRAKAPPGWNWRNQRNWWNWWKKRLSTHGLVAALGLEGGRRSIQRKRLITVLLGVLVAGLFSQAPLAAAPTTMAPPQASAPRPQEAQEVRDSGSFHRA